MIRKYILLSLNLLKMAHTGYTAQIPSKINENICGAVVTEFQFQFSGCGRWCIHVFVSSVIAGKNLTTHESPSSKIDIFCQTESLYSCGN